MSYVIVAVFFAVAGFGTGFWFRKSVWPKFKKNL